MAIRVIDLEAQRGRLGKRIDRAIARVLEDGRCVMGPEIEELETRLADFCVGRRRTGVLEAAEAARFCHSRSSATGIWRPMAIFVLPVCWR